MKTSKFKFSSLILATAMVVVLASCNKEDDDPKNIVETASSDSRFSILTEALTKAGLVTALEGTGPFTVFAPTNDAFNALFATLGVNGIDDLTA
jgi:transforming growth factor-beta-induced protein